MDGHGSPPRPGTTGQPPSTRPPAQPYAGQPVAVAGQPVYGGDPYGNPYPPQSAGGESPYAPSNVYGYPTAAPVAPAQSSPPKSAPRRVEVGEREVKGFMDMFGVSRDVVLDALKRAKGDRDGTLDILSQAARSPPRAAAAASRPGFGGGNPAPAVDDMAVAQVASVLAGAYSTDTIRRGLVQCGGDVAATIEWCFTQPPDGGATAGTSAARTSGMYEAAPAAAPDRRERSPPPATVQAAAPPALGDDLDDVIAQIAAQEAKEAETKRQQQNADVETLRGMFPKTPDAALQQALTFVDGDVQRAAQYLRSDNVLRGAGSGGAGLSAPSHYVPRSNAVDSITAELKAREAAKRGTYSMPQATPAAGQGHAASFDTFAADTHRDLPRAPQLHADPSATTIGSKAMPLPPTPAVAPEDASLVPAAGAPSAAAPPPAVKAPPPPPAKAPPPPTKAPPPPAAAPPPPAKAPPPPAAAPPPPAKAPPPPPAAAPPPAKAPPGAPPPPPPPPGVKAPAGGPPPPPPPGGKGKAAAKPLLSKAKRRALFWATINNNAISEDAVWGDIADDTDELFDEDEREKLDVAFAPKTRDTKEKDDKDKPARIQIIDSNRERNVGITLKFIRKPVEQICQAVLTFDESVLSEDLLEGVASIAPTGDDRSAVAPYMDKLETTDPALKAALSPPVRFFITACSMKAFGPRIDAWITQLQVPSHAEDLGNRATHIREALDCVKQSRQFPQLLKYILSVGNHLNEGTRHEKAKAFRISELDKFKMMKTSDGKATLVQVLVGLVGQKNPAVHDVVDELAPLRSLTSADLQSTADMAKSLRGRVRKFESFVQSNASDPHVAAKLQPNVAGLNAVVAQAEAECQRMVEGAEAVARYVSEDPAKFEVAKFAQTVLSFIDDYAIARRDIEERQRREERARHRDGR